MSFLVLIFKNTFRNKIRSFLAVMGIAIGIATIVGLGALSNGLTASFDKTMHVGGADFSILSKQQNGTGINPYGTSTFSEDWLSKIKEIQGVKDAKGIYLATLPVEGKFLTVGGLNYNDLKSRDSSLINGRNIDENANDEVIIGKLASDNLNKNVGDELDIGEDKFEIVGIFESGNSNQDGSIFTSLDVIQKMVKDEKSLSMISVYVEKGADIRGVAKMIEDKYGENISTVTSVSDVKRMDDLMNMINGASLAISLLAIIIGGVGIINTMIMTVFERTREIGVLRAVGWSRTKILSMILGESIVLTLFSAVIGSIIGVIVLKALVAVGMMGGIFSPVFTLETFIKGFVVAIFVGLIGGLYPALRASKLTPTEALGYE
ncbi:MAG: ABC transporter permease [Methanobrevibacter sp.]|jgi:putative ABC transport system permease protein|nr:ABC transporter permease [Candidatus Methanovirga aequatorialis]